MPCQRARLPTFPAVLSRKKKTEDQNPDPKNTRSGSGSLRIFREAHHTFKTAIIFNTRPPGVVKTAGAGCLHSPSKAATLCPMPRGLKVLVIALAVWIAFLAGTFLGIWVGGHYSRVAPLVSLAPQSIRSFFFPGDSLLQLESQIEGVLEEGYYKPVDKTSLENNAIDGMVKSLNDPYSEYLNPAAYQQFEEHSQGTFTGIGVSLEPKNGQLLVVSVISGSPAQEADIRSGDLIVSVNGQSLAGKTPEEATALIKGNAGTTVALRIKRGSQELDKPVVRKELELPIVTDKMLQHNGKKIGYIRLEQFSSEAGAEVKGSLDRLAGQGAQGIILDLRDNGGGLLDEAVNVASDFIPSGTIVSVVDRNSDRQTYTAKGDANASMPLVVLVNDYTASASEIVAGAVKDDSRGKLIGTKTFGKGVVQTLDLLPNGGAIKFTSGTYFTPKGININKVGIQPDIPAVDNPNTPADEVVDRALAVLAP